MPNSFWRQEGGNAARLSGEASEDIFAESMKYYTATGVCRPTRQYIKTRITSQCKPGFAKIVGRAAPDWFVNVKGHAVWVEAKTRKAKDFYTMPLDKTNVNQWEHMKDEIRFGAKCFYIFEWRHKSFSGGSEWRLYDVSNMKATVEFGKVPSVRFDREGGILVPSPNGWPDWVPHALA